MFSLLFLASYPQDRRYYYLFLLLFVFYLYGYSVSPETEGGGYSVSPETEGGGVFGFTVDNCPESQRSVENFESACRKPQERVSAGLAP